MQRCPNTIYMIRHPKRTDRWDVIIGSNFVSNKGICKDLGEVEVGMSFSVPPGG